MRPVTTTDDEAPEGTHAPPNDPYAEQCTLGAMMLSPDAIADVLPIVAQDGTDFYRPAHEAIFRTIVALYGDGIAVDAVTVAGALTDAGDIGRVGGAAYVHTLISAVPTATNAGYYAQRVANLALRRRQADVCLRHYREAMRGEGSGRELLDRLENAVASISPAARAEDYIPLRDLLDPTLARVEEIATGDANTQGVPTGLLDLDELTSGLHPGQMVIVAARPSCGKSTMALDWARSAAIKNQMTTVFFSLEMGRTEIVTRLLSAEARVPLHHMLTGSMTDEDWNRLARRMGEVSEAPLFIDDSPGLTMPAIRAKCRRLKQRNDLRLVVVDYMQLMNGGSRYEGNRQQEVSEISRSMKLLAKELEVPVVALSQLNRGPEQRADRKPLLSDLRESGSLEQDADVVLLLHREDLYEKESPRAGEADIIVAKHRNGPTGTITVAFQGHYSRFVDMAA